MKKLILLLMLGILIVGSAFIGVVNAEEQYIMRVSNLDPPDPWTSRSPSTASVLTLKAEVEKLSGGRIKVEVYSSSQLGAARSSAEQVKEGTIESALITTGVFASTYFKKFSIVDMPYTFSSREVARRLFDNRNPFTKKLIKECIDKTGVRPLSIYPFGYRHFTNNTRPIHSPDDMKGLKIRTMEVVPHMKLVEALGAFPTPVPFSELYTSLQTKVVDGQENPFSNVIAQRFYEVQKYLTVDGHVLGVSTLLVNEKWFQSLPDDLKVALFTGAEVAKSAFDGFCAATNSTSLEKIKSSGMEVYIPTPEEMAMFKEKAVPAVRKWMEKELGADFVVEYLNAIKAVEDEIKEEALAL